MTVGLKTNTNMTHSALAHGSSVFHSCEYTAHQTHCLTLATEEINENHQINQSDYTVNNTRESKY